LSLKGKPSLDRGSHEGTIRQDQWLFRRGRNDSRHRLRIILMRANLVTNRMSGERPGALLARRAPTVKRWSLDARSTGQPWPLPSRSSPTLLIHTQNIERPGFYPRILLFQGPSAAKMVPDA